MRQTDKWCCSDSDELALQSHIADQILQTLISEMAEGT